MKTVLIAPQTTRPRDFDHTKVRVSPFFPLGVSYLAGAILRGGHEVAVRDYLIEFFEEEDGNPYGDSMTRYGASDEEIRHDLRETHADVVGISCLFAAQEFDAELLCRLVREALPDAYIVMGGPHADASSVEFMDRIAALDAIVLGEGEDVLVALLNALESGTDLGSLDGFVWRKEDGTVARQRKTIWIDDLDALALPARELFDMDLYFRKAKPHNTLQATPCMQIITSRGCPFRCTFCSVKNHWGRQQRLRTSENVLAEIRLLVEDYGIRELHFEDDNLTLDKPRALKIFRAMTEAGWDLQWTAPSGLTIATLDEEMLTAMKESGCYSISLAVESGDQDVLTKLMRKPVRLEQVPRVVQMARGLDLFVRGFFMLGYPGETKASMRRTIDFALSLELDWAFFFIASPLPHTEMWESCVASGYFDASHYEPMTSLLRGQIETPEFTRREVEELREEAILECNFRHNPNLRQYDVTRAIRDFEGVLASYPHFDFAHVALGEAYARQGLMDLARVSWREGLRHNPDNADARRLLGIGCEAASAINGAVESKREHPDECSVLVES